MHRVAVTGIGVICALGRTAEEFERCWRVGCLGGFLVGREAARAMLARNVLLPPSPFEAAFVSLAHDAAVIDETIEAVKGALREAVA